MDVPTLIREIRSLSPNDRRLVLEAIETAEPVQFVDIMSDEDAVELNRRLDLDDAGLLSGEPLEVVKARWRRSP